MNGYNTLCIGAYNEGGYLWWGKYNNSTKLRLDVFDINNALHSASWDYSGIEYFNQWHYEVLIRDGTTYKYYFDREKIIELNVTEEIPAFEYGMFVGGFLATPAHNVLIADPFLGNPYDKDNNLVWTDDYVKQVYDMKSSFFVPPRAIVH